MPNFRLYILPFLLLCPFVSISQAAPYSYGTHQLQLTDLGAGVNPQAINNVGQVVGQAANSQAFLWSGGSTTPLGTVGGTQSFANDINDNGVAVGWSLDATGMTRAFRWTDGTGIVNIGGTSTTVETIAEAINNLDDVIGWRTNGTLYRTTIWDAANPTGLALFNNSGNTKGLGINDDGDVVGIIVESDGTADEGYHWDGFSNGGTSVTGGLGVDYFPYGGINQNNLTAGDQFGQGSYILAGFSDPAETFGKLDPADAFSSAYGLNDDGLIVGESGAKGTLYDLATDELFDLNLFPRLTPGFGQVLRLNDINNDGTFVGIALVDGVEHGFVGQLLVPEPSSWVLIGIGIATLAMARKVKRRIR